MTTKISKMLEKSREFDLDKADYTVPVKGVHFNEQGMMVLPEQAGLFENASVPPLAPTEWAYNQIFAKLAYTVYGKGTGKTLPPHYLLNIPEDLLATNLNRHIANANGDNWFVRGYKQDARAVLSEKYGVISNTEMLELLDQVVEEQATPDFKVIRPHVDPDSLHCKMVWKETDQGDRGNKGGNFGVGVYVKNGEVGNLSVGVYPMIQRNSCTNSIILDQDAGVRFRHFGDMTTKRVQIKSIIAEIFPLAADMLAKMIQAEEEKIPDFSDVLTGLSKKHGWDDETRMTISAGTEASFTRAGLVNGISFAAHEVHKDNPDEMASMEVLAGRILVAKDSVFARAAYVGRDITDREE